MCSFCSPGGVFCCRHTTSERAFFGFNSLQLAIVCGILPASAVEGPKESDGALTAVVYGIDSAKVEEVKTWRIIGADQFEVDKPTLSLAQAAGAKDCATRLEGSGRPRHARLERLKEQQRVAKVRV